MQIKEVPDTLVQFLALLKENGISEDEYQKYIGDFFEFSSRQKGIPLHGTFELTPLCNLNCKMCYVHLSNSQFGCEKLLSANILKKVIDEAYECGMRKASLTGGECLTYPCFEEIYLYLYEKGVRTNILTNGVLLNKQRIEFFKKFRPKSIQVTIYGSNNDAYEKVTGKRVFDTVKENIQNVHNAGLPIRLSITPSAFMRGDVLNTLELADQLKIPFNINASLFQARGNTGRQFEDLTVDEYIEVYKKRNELRHYNETITVDLKELPDPGVSSNNSMGLKCGAGRSSFVIKYDGTMSPCVSLYDIISYPLKYGFEQAWREINLKVNEYIRPAECVDCFYSTVCLKCVAFHEKAPAGHCDRRICQRTMKMVSAGVLPIPGKL